MAAVVLASTSSVADSGLLAHLLPRFTDKTGIEMRVKAQGSGRALESARRGDADLVLVHDPEAERKFIEDEDGLAPRQIAWNEFIIVGPAADPAHVRGGHDSIAALRAIDKAEVPFVSRGDRSGTNAMELRLWEEAGSAPEARAAAAWYHEVAGGMARALDIAAEMGAYTLSDRGTWLSVANKCPLVIEIEGDPRLVNRYDVIELNPRTHAKAELGAAKTLAEWLASSEGQAAIGDFKAGGERLFNPSVASPR